MDLDVMAETSSPSKLPAPEQPAEFLPPPQFFSALQIFQPAEEDRQGTAIKTSASFPYLKREDLKSWIWMQQVLHPEVDYERSIRKEWKKAIWKPGAIKKWLVEKKQKRKEQERLDKAEVYAAVSMASIAAALAAVAAENAEMRNNDNNSGSKTVTVPSKESAVASAAALVAARCAKAAEDAGAKRDQLAAAIKAAMTATNVGGILTLTAAAATSLRGAATLRERSGAIRKQITGGGPALPTDDPLDFPKSKASLANGAEFLVVTPDGVTKQQTVYVIVGRHTKVVLRLKKSRGMTPFTTVKECIIHGVGGSQDEDAVAKPQEEAEEDARRCYSIVLATSSGEVKLKTGSLSCYMVWTRSIACMLTLSSTFRNRI